MDERLKLQRATPFLKSAAVALGDQLVIEREPEEEHQVVAPDSDVRIERTYEIAKSDEKKRYTLGPLYVPDYVDAHGEFTDADNIEIATWDYVRTGNREINHMHSTRRVGEWVGLLPWPYPVEVEMIVPGSVQKSRKVKFPPGTPFMGVVWDEWAWDELVVPGHVRGFSMEGFSTRVMVDNGS